MSDTSTGYCTTSAGSSKAPLPLYTLNPPTVSLYSGHSDPFNFVTSRYLPSVSYATQFGNMLNDVEPVGYNDTTNSSVSASLMSYTIEQPQV